MHQRRRLFMLSILSSMALSLMAQEPASTPAPEPAAELENAKPGDTVKIPEHWSKWEYPKEVTIPEKSQLYMVVKGDCLWFLGERFLGNPFSWPQIWEQNKWVKDPHWIYPGNPLIIPVEKKFMGTAGTTPATPFDVAELQPDRLQVNRKPIADEFAFTFQDFIQLPFLAPKGAKAYLREADALSITQRRAKERSFLGDGETIYLSGGEDRGVKVGDRLLILKVKKKALMHPMRPKDKKPIGDIIQQIGVLRVIEVKPKGAVAQIEKSMDSVEVGDYAVRFTEPTNIPSNVRTDVQGAINIQEPTGTIIYTREDHQNTATGEMVIIDRGSKDGLQVGDVLLSARWQSWPVGDDSAPQNRAEEKAVEATEGPTEGGVLDRLFARKPKSESGVKGKMTLEKTNYYVGQVMVVRADENSATCRILRANEEMFVGDIVSK